MEHRTSQAGVVPFELMAFPSKETEVTGLSDMPEMMTGVTLRAGKEGIPVPKAICYSVTVLWQQGILPNQVTVTCIAAVYR